VAVFICAEQLSFQFFGRLFQQSYTRKLRYIKLASAPAPQSSRWSALRGIRSIGAGYYDWFCTGNSN
jgi:hypothetical protein